MYYTSFIHLLALENVRLCEINLQLVNAARTMDTDAIQTDFLRITREIYLISVECSGKT